MAMTSFEKRLHELAENSPDLPTRIVKIKEMQHEIDQMQSTLEDLTGDAVRDARAVGISWNEISTALGMNRQTVVNKWRDLTPARPSLL